MSSRIAWTLAVSWCVHGCSGALQPPLPTTRPVPDAWRPADVLAEHVPPGHAKEIVLDDRDGLSPDEAAIMAIDQHPRLRALRAQRGLGQAELIAARVLPNPRLDGSFSFPVSGDEARVLGYGVGLSWNVTPLISRRARISAAKEGLESIDLEVAWQEWQVAQAARLHACRSIHLERRVQLATEIEATWQRSVDALRQAREADAVPQLDVTNAERSLAGARVSRLALEHQRVTARMDLALALGVDPTLEVVLDASATEAAPLPSRDAILDDLPSRRLDLIALGHAQRSHDEALRAATLDRFPPLDVGFQVGRDVDDVGYAGLTLGVELPFFERNQGAVARERAQRVQLDAEYEARLFEARADVVRILEETRVIEEQLVAAREAADAAERVAEQARTAAAGGALGSLLVVDRVERAQADRLRVLEIEQTLAELRVALAMVSGVDVR